MPFVFYTYYKLDTAFFPYKIVLRNTVFLYILYLMHADIDFSKLERNTTILGLQS